MLLAGSTTNANAAYSQGFGPGTELNAGFDNCEVHDELSAERL